MVFTKSTAYALQALVVLSRYEKPVDVNTISELTDIPKPFLAKLLQNLSKNNFVKSYKGIHGGFLLSKDPSEIKILDLFKILEDKDSIVFYCSKGEENCVRNRGDICVLRPFFAMLEEKIDKIIENYTLEDIIRMKAGK